MDHVDGQMTVKELIRNLGYADQDSPVFLQSGEEYAGGTAPLLGVVFQVGGSFPSNHVVLNDVLGGLR